MPDSVPATESGTTNQCTHAREYATAQLTVTMVMLSAMIASLKSWRPREASLVMQQEIDALPGARPSASLVRVTLHRVPNNIAILRRSTPLRRRRGCPGWESVCNNSVRAPIQWPQQSLGAFG